MKFTVVTYNIFCREKLLFKDAQKTRAKLIPQALAKYNKDIDCILIQEIFDESSEKILDKEMKKQGYLYKSRKTGSNPFLKCMCFCGKVEDSGLKTYSKYPITSECDIIFENAGSTDKIANKGCLFTRIKKEGKNYNVFNTHLEAGDTNQMRFNQMGEIREFMDNLELPKNEPFILGGDFNIDVRSNDFHKAESILDMYPVPIDKTTFNKERNGMQRRSNPEQEHLAEQSQIDLIMIGNEYQKPTQEIMKFTNLESENPFKIRKVLGSKEDCCLKICRKLHDYGDYIDMKALADHEPRIGILEYN